MVQYMGLTTDSVPSQRQWVTRISNPNFATSQRDRWCGLFFWVILIVGATSQMIRGPWIWYVVGWVDIVIAVPALVKSLLWIVQRRPTL